MVFLYPAVRGCIQLCPSWERPQPLEGPRCHFPSCSFMFSASCCSLGLGHSKTKHCFSTRYTKSFLKAAGVTRGAQQWGHCFHWVVPHTMLCQRKMTQEPCPPSVLSLVTCPSSGERGWLWNRRAGKKLNASITLDIKMSLKESKSPPKTRGGKNSLQSTEKHWEGLTLEVAREGVFLRSESVFIILLLCK